jgi:hypothetical protein
LSSAGGGLEREEDWGLSIEMNWKLGLLFFGEHFAEEKC